MQEGRTTSELTFEITEQEGSTFVGRTQFGDFVGVIAPNGRTVHWVDDDGQSMGTITAPDTMEVCYVEIADENQVTCMVAKKSGS